MRGEVMGAEQALFLARHRNEQYRTFELHASLVQRLGCLEKGSNSGSVVHGSVVDVIALHCLAAAEMIEMGREYDELAAQLGIGSGINRGHVLRFEGVVFRLHVGFEHGWYWKNAKALSGLSRGVHFFNL